MDLSRRFFLRKKIDKLNHLPWIKDQNTFFDLCTRCKKCLTACPNQIIVEGDGGFMQIDFKKGECSLCYKCAAICPEPIFEMQTKRAWIHKISIKGCIVIDKNVPCPRCSEDCSYGAIIFKNGTKCTLEIDLDRCNGCGACIRRCPVKAISLI